MIFEVTQREARIDDAGTLTVYGIAVCGLPTGKETCVENISTDREFVERLCDRMRKGQLHPVHLMDVVLDAIG